MARPLSAAAISRLYAAACLHTPHLGSRFSAPNIDSISITQWPGVAAQAILDVRYTFPKGLSRDCRDLIRGLFHKDPDQRLSIAEIKKHPWFTANLPEEMSVSTSFLSVWRFSSPEVWSGKGLDCSAGQRWLTASLQDEMSGGQCHPEYESMHRQCIVSLL